MAFIYKAEKSPNLFPPPATTVGPGEYLDKIPKITPKQNQEPFLSSSDRYIPEKNENPGPGTYYRDFPKVKSMKNFENSVNNRNTDLIVARVKRDGIIFNQGEKLGFDTKAKRFISTRGIGAYNELEKTPGPGHYFPSIFNITGKAYKNKNRNRNNLIKLDKGKEMLFKSNLDLSDDKVNKNKNFLYNTIIIENETKKGKNDINKLRKTFQYDNFACRPKIFNIRKFKEIMEYNNENNSLTSTNYSDQRNRTKFNKFLKTYDLTDSLSFKESYHLKNNAKNVEKTKNMQKFYKNKDSENKNAMKYRINFCKKINNKTIKSQLENDFDNIFENKTPGPGYYFDDIIKDNTSFKQIIPKNKNLQNYFTKVQRFYSLKKPWTNLGPGEYINIDKKNEKKRLMDNPANIDIPFGSQEKRNNTFLCLEHTIGNPGPGKYNYQQFINDNNTNINPDIDIQFGFTGPRFNDKYDMRDKYAAPGPGYYISKINSISYNNKKNLKKEKMIFLNQPKFTEKIKALKKNEKNRFLNGKYASLDELKYKERIPPVGYYYPEYFSTIEYKNKMNLLNSKGSEIYNNMGVSTKLKKSESSPNIVGPGYYNINRDINKNNIYSNALRPPFNSSEQKKSYPKKKKKYRMNFDEYFKNYAKEYFNWNKKSFNANFA